MTAPIKHKNVASSNFLDIDSFKKILDNMITKHGIVKLIKVALAKVVLVKQKHQMHIAIASAIPRNM